MQTPCPVEALQAVVADVQSGAGAVLDAAAPWQVAAMSAEAEIQDMVDRETRVRDAGDAGALVDLSHPDMVWPWPRDGDSHEPVDGVFPYPARPESAVLLPVQAEASTVPASPAGRDLDGMPVALVMRV